VESVEGVRLRSRGRGYVLLVVPVPVLPVVEVDESRRVEVAMQIGLVRLGGMSLRVLFFELGPLKRAMIPIGTL
jgi:hypothetical protein